MRLADALEAASKLELYFNQMTADFAVIHDLLPEIDDLPNDSSPAHFSPPRREEELKFWASLGIECLSYATVGGRAFTFGPGPAPVFNLTNPLDDLKVAQACGQAADTDISYRLCYPACAGGSLKRPDEPGQIRRVVGPRPPEPLELWDNDGIVNTVSMLWPLLWPKGEIALVQADHLDIVGHFCLDNAGHEPPSESRSYDILRSTPKFDADNAHTFKTVWDEIFKFAARPKAYHPATTGLHGPVAIAAEASGG